ncbi:2-amino-4-hydroxy-6-hydroxymethyldihydropteridine diphosphokinase [Candidatus Parcubacteria bacterium]|nr:MAG: 2-amino-4-hydroxy-6-hydroxymethyldihydropteridine diphosphokinase [Candidatus Parcubacteria bacterium]
MGEMANVYLGLGSNKGDRLENMRSALKLLAPFLEIHKVSRVYESVPMYKEDQDLFLNAALHGRTELSPQDLLVRVKEVEKALGRQEGERNGPREIDIDILLYDDLVHQTDDLTIPHPKMHERLFVMVPLEEIASIVSHPVHGRLVIEMREDLGPLGDTLWEIQERL